VLSCAQGTRAGTLLRFEQECLRLKVQDDGAGFTMPERLSTYAKQNKLGILGIEQRVISVGGTVELHSCPGMGTTLSAVIPYRYASEL
jgi:signal transduction histidine kinase